MGRSDLNNIDANPPVRSQRDVLLMDDASDATLWTATDAAQGLASTSTHVLGSQGLSFDKVAGDVDAGVSRGFGGGGLDASARFSASDMVELVLAVPSGISGLDVVVLRLGANAANYAEWSFPRGDVVAGEWSRLAAEIAAQDPAAQAGNGMDLASLRFAQVVVRMTAPGKTFVGAVLDSVVVRGR